MRLYWPWLVVFGLLFISMFAQYMAWRAREPGRQRPPPQQSMHHAAPAKVSTCARRHKPIVAMACAYSTCWLCDEDGCWGVEPGDCR